MSTVFFLKFFIDEVVVVSAAVAALVPPGRAAEPSGSASGLSVSAFRTWSWADSGAHIGVMLPDEPPLLSL